MGIKSKRVGRIKMNVKLGKMKKKIVVKYGNIID